jgi:hypothetical protein
MKKSSVQLYDEGRSFISTDGSEINCPNALSGAAKTAGQEPCALARCRHLPPEFLVDDQEFGNDGAQSAVFPNKIFPVWRFYSGHGFPFATYFRLSARARI